MSDDPRTPAVDERQADLIASKVAERLIETLTDQRTVDRVTEAWSGTLDKMLGRGLRRLAGTVLVAALLWGAVKFELLGKLLGVRG